MYDIKFTLQQLFHLLYGHQCWHPKFFHTSNAGIVSCSACPRTSKHRRRPRRCRNDLKSAWARRTAPCASKGCSAARRASAMWSRAMASPSCAKKTKMFSNKQTNKQTNQPTNQPTTTTTTTFLCALRPGCPIFETAALQRCKIPMMRVAETQL